MKILDLIKKKEKRNSDDERFYSYTNSIANGNILFDNNNINETKIILQELIDNENKYKSKTISNSLNRDEVLKLLKKDITETANFNPNNFTGNWLSSLDNYGQNLKYKILFRLGRKKGFFTCLTYQQVFLKNLYDSNNTMKQVLQIPIFIAFNNLNIVKKKENKKNDIEFDKKVKYIKKQLLSIIELCELTGGAIISVDKDIIKIEEKENKKIEEKDFSYKEKQKYLPIRSINRPLGSACCGVKPFGLSWFEDKIEALERDNESIRALHETMMRQAMLLLKIPEKDFSSSPNQIEKQALEQKLKDISTRDPNATITIPYGADADFKTANVNLLEHLDIHNQAKQELSCGVPNSIWKGENNGTINIGGNDDGSCVLLNNIKQLLRNNYNDFILELSKQYLQEDVVIDYQDIKDIDGRKEIDSLEKLSNIIISISSNNVDLQDEVKDLQIELLNKIKTLI